MNILIITTSEPSNWSTLANSFELTFVNSYESGIKYLKNREYIAIICDDTIENSHLVYNVEDLLKAAYKTKIYVRFEKVAYNDQVFVALTKCGVITYFIDYPSGETFERIHYFLQGGARFRSMEYGDMVLCGQVLKSMNMPDIRFTAKETLMLRVLMRAKGDVVTKDQLLTETDYSADTITHTIETHLYRLRSKLSKNGYSQDIILTVAGGYRFRA